MNANIIRAILPWNGAQFITKYDDAGNDDHTNGDNDNDVMVVATKIMIMLMIVLMAITLVMMTMIMVRNNGVNDIGGGHDDDEEEEEEEEEGGRSNDDDDDDHHDHDNDDDGIDDGDCDKIYDDNNAVNDKCFGSICSGYISVFLHVFYHFHASVSVPMNHPENVWGIYHTKGHLLAYTTKTNNAKQKRDHIVWLLWYNHMCVDTWLKGFHNNNAVNLCQWYSM